MIPEYLAKSNGLITSDSEDDDKIPAYIYMATSDGHNDSDDADAESASDPLCGDNLGDDVDQPGDAISFNELFNQYGLPAPDEPHHLHDEIGETIRLHSLDANGIVMNVGSTNATTINVTDDGRSDDDDDSDQRALLEIHRAVFGTSTESLRPRSPPAIQLIDLQEGYKMIPSSPSKMQTTSR